MNTPSSEQRKRYAQNRKHRLETKRIFLIQSRIEEGIRRLDGSLKAALEAELRAGNRVVDFCDTYPDKHSVLLTLEKIFQSPIRRDIEGVTFINVNDPHWWKAEYCDLAHKQYLICPFNGPNFDLL